MSAPTHPYAHPPIKLVEKPRPTTPHSAAANAVIGPALRLEKVNLTLGRTAILREVSFAVAAGSVHALIGPNGGGKSSLVKTLLGQMPHQGTVALDWSGEPGVIGYVPQTLEFDKGLPMTVEDFMAAMTQRRPAFLGTSPRLRYTIHDALAQVGMADKRYRRMGALSGGERQRVLLAQALIPVPGLLILDEPMAALDEAGIRVFESVLAEKKRTGTTVLWIEHDLDAVLRLADRVTGLSRSALYDGPPAEILTPERLLGLFMHRPDARTHTNEVAA